MGEIKPYYEELGITIYHGDCREVLPQLDPVDLVLTDPPYSSITHSGARTGKCGEDILINFPSVSSEELLGYFNLLSPLVKKWLIATCDWRHIARIEEKPPQGLRFVRFGIWVKPNGAPQFSGDRPGTGWEAIAFLHRQGGKMEWLGGGRGSVFTHLKINGDHPTQKPLTLIGELIELFSKQSEVILDPFMGSGTTLLATKNLGRKAIGIEIEEKYCEIAVKRLAQEVLPLEFK